MYNFYIYKDSNGNEPIRDYLDSLSKKTDKDSRIKKNKIFDYLETLTQHGTRAGLPYVKHLVGDIWELRPLRDRILFASVVGKQFVLLHIFVKSTQKTPAREIEKAKANLADYLRRTN